jgi:hypothetical protein
MNFSFAQFDHTEDPSWFTDFELSVYDVIIFLHNSGEVLDQDGKDALERYLQNGGNFVGIHSASDCLRDTSFYGAELGAWFDYHPEISNAVSLVIRHYILYNGFNSDLSTIPILVRPLTSSTLHIRARPCSQLNGVCEMKCIVPGLVLNTLFIHF